MLKRLWLFWVCVLLSAPAGASQDQDARWQNHMERAISSHQQGQLDAAERHLTAALEIAEGFEPGDRRLSQNLTGLATVHFDQTRFDAAEPLLRRALVLDERILGPGHPFVAHNLSALGLVYLRQGLNPQAEPLFKRALRIFEASDGKEGQSTGRFIGQTLANLAGLYFLEGRVEEAEPLFGRALPLQEKSLGPRDPAFITLLENYATTLRLLDRTPEAEALEARARTLSK